MDPDSISEEWGWHLNWALEQFSLSLSIRYAVLSMRALLQVVHRE